MGQKEWGQSCFVEWRRQTDSAAPIRCRSGNFAATSNVVLRRPAPPENSGEPPRFRVRSVSTIASAGVMAKSTEFRTPDGLQ
jgi:hypothetical protein